MLKKSAPSLLSRQKIPKKMDLLLKAAMEECFSHLLRFFYKDAEQLFDMEREFEYMNKELLEIYPERLKSGGARLADVLVKVFMKDGNFQWFLVHLELQGKHSAVFPYRMFEYYYRLVDRYKVPVIAFAIFTGAKNQQFSQMYHSNLLGTELMYRYHTYQIFQHSSAELLAMDNPFALLVLATQKAHLENKVSEAELGKDRILIFKAMLATGKYDDAQMMGFLGFLKQMIYIADPEINRQFDLEVHNLEKGEHNMGKLWDVVSVFMREEALMNARKELEGPVGDQIKLAAEIEARKGFEELRIGFLNKFKEEAKKSFEEETRKAIEEGVRRSVDEVMVVLFPPEKV